MDLAKGDYSNLEMYGYYLVETMDQCVWIFHSYHRFDKKVIEKALRK
jgi:IS1 family transposase